MPNPHAIAVLALTIVVFYLYSRPRIRMEVVSFVLLLALQFLERQYGLDKVVANAMSGDNVIHEGVSALTEALSGVVGWIRAYLQL